MDESVSVAALFLFCSRFLANKHFISQHTLDETRLIPSLPAVCSGAIKAGVCLFYFMKMSFWNFYLVSQSNAGLQGVQNKQLLCGKLFSQFFQPFEIINKIQELKGSSIKTQWKRAAGRRGRCI